MADSRYIYITHAHDVSLAHFCADLFSCSTQDFITPQDQEFSVMHNPAAPGETNKENVRQMRSPMNISPGARKRPKKCLYQPTGVHGQLRAKFLSIRLLPVEWGGTWHSFRFPALVCKHRCRSDVHRESEV